MFFGIFIQCFFHWKLRAGRALCSSAGHTYFSSECCDASRSRLQPPGARASCRHQRRSAWEWQPRPFRPIWAFAEFGSEARTDAATTQWYVVPDNRFARRMADKSCCRKQRPSLFSRFQIRCLESSGQSFSEVWHIDITKAPLFWPLFWVFASYICQPILSSGGLI